MTNIDNMIGLNEMANMLGRACHTALVNAYMYKL